MVSESARIMFGWKEISLASSVETITTSEKLSSSVFESKSRMKERTIGPSSSTSTVTASRAVVVGMFGFPETSSIAATSSTM